jgi:TM2 domain-containing membrane protein YozV
LGVLGIHRFMTGKVLSGIGMLVAGGGLGIWWLLDLRSVATGAFRDKQGLLVAMPPCIWWLWNLGSY